MQPITIKIPTGLVTEMAKQRFLVSKYETHRGFKGLAFYLLARTLTTSNGIYRKINDTYDLRSTKDGHEAWSRFNKHVGKQIGFTFNTVNNNAKYAEEFGLLVKTPMGYQFNSVEKIAAQYGLFFPTGEITYHTITIQPNESLEHILKTLVFGENFAKQEYAVMQKIRRIPGVKEKLGNYIPNWKELPAKQLLKQIVAWQKKTFVEYTKGTEAYDLFHSIHADIALTCNRIAEHFSFKSKQSSMYIKSVLSKLQYIAVEKRSEVSHATRKPHEPDGKCKPLTFIWLPGQMKRKWLMPDLITLNLK